ncbi:hypothetical protein [Leifsonia xyli]
MTTTAFSKEEKAAIKAAVAEKKAQQEGKTPRLRALPRSRR